MNHFQHRFGGADPPDDYNPICDDCNENTPCKKYPCERLDAYLEAQHKADLAQEAWVESMKEEEQDA